MTFLPPDIPYLRELALNNNPLQKIEGHAFEMVRRNHHHHHHDNVQVPQIVSLDVSGCQIKKIAARAFQQVTIAIIVKVIIIFKIIVVNNL